MSEWLCIPNPEGDPERVHVVPGVEGEPDPIHDPSPDCACRPRIQIQLDITGRRHQIVVHAGPN